MNSTDAFSKGEKSEKLLTPSCLKCTSICSSAPLQGNKGLILTSPSGEPCNQKIERQLGVFDIFKVGLGPSSSHTNGPMLAGYRFIEELREKGVFDEVDRVQIDLFGSLALTGAGHRTDQAVCVGLSGELPSTVEPDKADNLFRLAKFDGVLKLGGQRKLEYIHDRDMVWHYDKELPQHPNALHITAFCKEDQVAHFNEYLSLGGGFIQTVAEFEAEHTIVKPESYQSTRADSYERELPTSEILHYDSEYDEDTTDFQEDEKANKSSNCDNSGPNNVPYPFWSAAELLMLCREHDMTIAEIMMENEKVVSHCDANAINRKLDDIWRVMSECIERGITKEGVMPVSGIRRMSPKIYKKLTAGYHKSLTDHFAIMDWVCLYARAVNEENACGGRIVTAPTNGASGTVPAVLSYFANFSYKSSPQGIRDFLLTSAAFGILIKTNASISGAEAGCQAEVGSACAMAAAGLTAAVGGTCEQIENAAEIGLEHNLGMTCDPIQGLVQVPCIERNCLAAVKAITAHRLSLQGDGQHEVSFDSCVETMQRTGMDMQTKYRETSKGGLALYARKPGHILRGARLRVVLSTLDLLDINEGVNPKTPADLQSILNMRSDGMKNDDQSKSLM